MKILIDAMGGDLAPKAPVLGALQARQRYGCDIVLIGKEDVIRATLTQESVTDLPQGLEIQNATEVVEICDNPSTAWRAKKDSSLTVGLKLLKSGAGDAFLSAGSTGAILSGATLLVKRIPGIRRAAVAPVIPTRTGRAVLIDAGANADCTPEYMMQFAFMGSFYAKQILGTETPRVGLLNIGAEPSKGNEQYKMVHQLLQEAGDQGRIHFIGNVEGSSAVEGAADVIVCDGFVGNIFLKTLEGTASFLMHELKDAFFTNLSTKLSALVLKKHLAGMRKKLDPREVGGTALLGIQKPVIKAHGSSDAYAICSAVGQAIQFAQSSLVADIQANMDSMTVHPGADPQNAPVPPLP
jgi:glycerol-3-phosphate acyltransferase PlsX